MFSALSPIISILLAIGIFIYFSNPMFADIKEIQTETNEYKEAVEKATEFNNVLQGLLVEANSLSSLELERLEMLVPDKIDEVRLLVDLKAMAENQDMLFGNIEVSEPVSNIYIDSSESSRISVSSDDFSSLEISFELIGTYEQLKAMLADVERSLVFMEILKFNFTISPDSDLQQYSFTVRMRSLTPFVQ